MDAFPGLEADGAPRSGSLKLYSGELAAFENSPEALRVAVLEADQELVDTLMLRGYAGPEWRRFASALAEYGVGVMRAWIRSGQVFEKCRKRRAKGLKNLPLYPRTAEDALELAGLTVAVAIRTFREKVLIPRRWRPDKGASLKTFFVGQCLFQFKDVYLAWVRETHLVAVEHRTHPQELVLLLRPPQMSVPDIVEFRRQVGRLRDMGAPAMAALMQTGFSHDEIAESFGTSRKSVETKLYRYRHAKVQP